MGTGHHSPGSGNARYTSSERKPPFSDRSDAHLLVRSAAEAVAEDYQENAPEGEVDPDAEHIQTALRQWGNPLRDGAVGGSPAERRAASGDSGSGGGGGAVAVGRVGMAASSGRAAEVGGEQRGVGAVALAGRDESVLLDEQISDVRGLGAGRLDALHEAGVRTPADVLQQSTEDLTQIDSIGESVAERIQERVAQQYERPEMAVDYGFGIGGATNPDDLDWGLRFVDDVDDATSDVIGDLNFEIMTLQGEDGSPVYLDSSRLDDIQDTDKQEAVREIEVLYQSSAAKMAAHARDDETAQRIFENVASGTTRVPQIDYPRPKHGQSEGGSRLKIPKGSVELDLMHELGHATTFAHGYDVAPAARENVEEYTNRLSETNTDPFVAVDPDDPDNLLSQDNGEVVEGVSEEFETLIDRTNDAFQRIHRAAERGEPPESYVAGINYSGLSATEFFGVFHSYMQADERTHEEHKGYDKEGFSRDVERMLYSQPEVAKAYFEVFEPGDVPAESVQDLRDLDRETPYDDYQLPSERSDSL